MYIKEKNYLRFFKNDCERVFLRPYNIQTNNGAIVNLMENGTLDKQDTKLLEFLYTNKFATLEQLERIGYFYGVESVKERLSTMFTNSIVNKIGFTDQPDRRLPSDALILYCLADGGKHILEHYTDRQIIWECSNVCQLPSVIGDCLIYNELYLAFLFNKKVKHVTSEADPKFYLRSEVLTTTANHQFSNGEDVLYLMSDIIHTDMDVFELRKHLRLIEAVVTTQIWKRFFGDGANPPIVIFIVENDDSAKFLTKEVYQSSKVRDFRLTTPERLNGTLGRTGAFMKYDEASETLIDVKVGMFDE